MMDFLFPWASLGLAALPALILIYWLQRKPKKALVPSLMFWRDQRRMTTGGRKIRRRRLPWLVAMEILLILLWVLAAMGPRVASRTTTHPLVLILDNSYSMRAGALNRARAFLTSDADLERYHPIHVVLVDKDTEYLGSVSDVAALDDVLGEWNAHGRGFAPDRVSPLLGSLGLDAMPKLIMTDTPREALGASTRQIAWGEPLDNAAFSRAVREGNRLWLEITWYAPEPHQITWICRAEDGTVLDRRDLAFEPHQTLRLDLGLPDHVGPVDLVLEGDTFEYDNSVTLLPAEPARLTVRNALPPSPLAEFMEAALVATNRVDFVTSDADLTITDEEEGEGHLLIITRPDRAISYLGPFFEEIHHPLLQGLSLDGVIWGAGRWAQARGCPLIQAGDIPLLTESRTPKGKLHLWMDYHEGISTLHKTANWPALFHNKVNHVLENQPGCRTENLIAGQRVTWVNDPEWEHLAVVQPDGEVLSQAVFSDRQTLTFDEPGMVRVRAGDLEHRFSVSVGSSNESDLLALGRADQGRLGMREESLASSTDWTWTLLLISCVLLGLHGLWSR